MEKHPPAYLSASRFAAYDRCPQVFYARYVAKTPEPPSWEREFGTAVHKGLEAHYRDEDYEMAFLRCWREAVKACKTASIAVPDHLGQRGLELIEMVRNMGLSGVPEKWVTVLPPGFTIPIIGYADLANDEHIYDFKTTMFSWTQDRADRETFQPAIYAQAHADQYGMIPRFTFVVLPRNGGPLQLRDGTRTGDQIIEAFDKMRAIHERIEAQEWTCTCRSRLCGKDAA